MQWIQWLMVYISSTKAFLTKLPLREGWSSTIRLHLRTEKKPALFNIVQKIFWSVLGIHIAKPKFCKHLETDQHSDINSYNYHHMCW